MKLKQWVVVIAGALLGMTGCKHTSVPMPRVVTPSTSITATRALPHSPTLPASPLPTFTPTPKPTDASTPLPTPIPSPTAITLSAEIKARLKISNLYEAKWSPDSKYFAVATAKGLYLYLMGSLKQLRQFGANQKFNSLDFSPDGTTIVTASDTGLQLWDVQTGDLVREWGNTEGPVYKVVFSPDGAIVAASGGFSRDGAIQDEIIYIWESTTAQLLHSIEPHDTWLATLNFSPDGRYLVSGANDGVVRVWVTATGKNAGFSMGAGFWWQVSGAAFLQNDRTLLFVLGNRVEIWEWRKSLQLARFAGFDDIHRIEDRILSISLASDQRVLALAREDTRLQLWILPNAELVDLSDTKTQKPEFVVFNPAGDLLAVGSTDAVEFWSIQRK